MEALFWLIIVLIGAFILGELSKFVKLPRVLGYLLAGILLANLAFLSGFEQSSDILTFLKDLGIVFLFFFIGLGIDTTKFRESFAHSIKLGTLTTFVSFLAGALFWMLLGNDVFSSFVVGICVSVSAQAVCMMVLDETKLLNKKLGRDLVEAGIVADILQLVGISIVFGFIPTVSKFSLSRMALNWVVFILIIFGIKLVLFPLFQKTLKDNEERITFFFGAIILSAIMGYLGEILGIGSILGAIFAGALIRQFFDAKIVSRLTKDFKLIGFGFLIPVLFVLTGYESQLLGVTTGVLFGFILALLALLGNIVGAFLALPKYNKKDKVLAGIGLSSKGDIEIILATVLFQASLISSMVFSTIIMMSLFTMILAPMLFYLVYNLIGKKKPA